MAIGRQFVDSQPPGVDPRNLTPLHQHLYRPHDVDLMQWDVSQTHHHDRKYDKERFNIDIWMPGQTNYCANESRWRSSHSDLEFVKKFTRPNFSDERILHTENA